MKRPCFLFLSFLFFPHSFFVTPQKHLSGIDKTKLESIEKKIEGEKTIVSLLFSNIIKEVKRENIYPKNILNNITLSFKGKKIIISYKTASFPNMENKTLSFSEAVIDSHGRIIDEFSIEL